MANKPILFSTEMVQAILAGRKTQTRRIIKLDDDSLPDDTCISHSIELDSTGEMIQGKPDVVMDFSKTFPYWKEKKPKYQIGDVIWVRETWTNDLVADGDGDALYTFKAEFPELKGVWKPSIFMPKDACRLFLKVTNVRVEKLQDISQEDAEKEGVEIGYEFKSVLGINIKTYKNYLFGEFKWITPSLSFQTLWQKINGPNSWDENPWVWIYDFEVTKKPADFMP